MNPILSVEGIGFWKVGSRKIFTVLETDFERQRNESSPTSKRRRSSASNNDSIAALESAVDSLVTEVSDIKKELSKFSELAFRHKFSLSFIASFEEAFKCCICMRTPANLPIIGCQACSNLIGCQQCINIWYTGADAMEKPCPKCRAERGLTKTFILKGFDEVVNQIGILNGVEAEATDN